MQDDERLKRLLGYANPYAISNPIALPPAQPANFIGQNLAAYRWIFEQRKVEMNLDELEKALARDPCPIPATTNREGYNGDDHLGFWLSGYVTYLQLKEIALRNEICGGRYLDFGGSTGRVFRHFQFQSKVWQVMSCDFKMSSVDWNTQYYPSDIEVFQNSYNPVLPIESNSIALVSAMSVFTHIDETESSWLMELRRILQPGGLLLATVHDENTWQCDKSLRDNAIKLNPSWTEAEMPEGRRVSTWRIDDPYRCNVFQSQSYIRRQWARFMDVVEILPCSFGAQTMVVLKKRNC